MLAGFVHRVGMMMRLSFLLLCGFFLVGCGSRATRPPAAAPVTAPVAGQINDVLFRAIGLVGTPYRYGGNTPAGGFDCSGLVGYVYRESAGIALPRTTRELAELSARNVSQQQLIPGDLVFFGQRQISHIGIYVGEGRFVHAPSSGGTVRMDALEGTYWKTHYRFAKRILR